MPTTHVCVDSRRGGRAIPARRDRTHRRRRRTKEGERFARREESSRAESFDRSMTFNNLPQLRAQVREAAALMTLRAASTDAAHIHFTRRIPWTCDLARCENTLPRVGARRIELGPLDDFTIAGKSRL